MGYSIDWSDLEQRIQDQKAALLDTSQNMDPERLKFLVETYDECKGESVFITRAKLFEKVLNNKKIYLDGNPIVGSLAGGRAMIYAYPEWQCNWVKDDLDSEKLALSSLGEVRFSDETKEILKKVYKTWKGKTTYDRANKLYKELYGGNAELLVKCGWIYPVNDNSTGSGVADYPAMLTKGIRGILEEVETAYRALPKHATNWTKIEFYRACKIALNAVIAYAHRYAELAEETAKAETNPKKQAELMEIAEVCRRVPEFPARNFREALQSFWFTHCCIQIEQCGCGHSLGRYGQYMYPFYKKDLDEAKEILEENKESLRFDHIETDSHIGKVSIVGAGLMTNCGMAARMFEALYEAGINIQMINTSEIRVSVLLDENDVDRAVRAIHAKFFDEA